MDKESPEQRFIRLAEARVNKVLTGYRVLANLKSSNYSSTQEQRSELIRVLQEGLYALEAHYAGEKLAKAKFKFSSTQFEVEEEPLIQ